MADRTPGAGQATVEPAARPEPVNPPAAPVAGTAAPSLPPRRQHPSWIVLGAIPALRAVAVPLLLILFTGGGDGEIWLLVAGGGLALAGVVARAVVWWQFRYEVTSGELRVRSGVLARRERYIPLERIQAVDVSETPLQRVFGVVGVKVETAAGGAAQSDVVLPAVARAEADLLRERLAARRPDAATIPVPETAAGQDHPPAPRAGGGALIRALSPTELLVAGATSGRVGPALAVIFGAYQLVDDVVPDWFWERVAMSAPGFSLRGLFTLVIIVGVGAWLLAVISTVLTYGGFELRRDEDRLQVSYGLLDRRRSTIPVARIQAVTVTEGLLRQPLGLAALRVESAGYGKDTAESGVLFPLLPRAAVPDLLARACPDFAADLGGTTLAPLPARARRRYLLGNGATKLVWLAIVLTAAAAAAPVAPWWWGLAPLPLVPVAALYGLCCFRDTGWALDDADRFVVRARAIARATTVIPRRRLQRREVKRGPLQRRTRLATLRAAVASGGGGGQVTLAHLDEETAFALVTRLGPGGRPKTGGGAGKPGARRDSAVAAPADEGATRRPPELPSTPSRSQPSDIDDAAVSGAQAVSTDS